MPEIAAHAENIYSPAGTPAELLAMQDAELAHQLLLHVWYSLPPPHLPHTPWDNHAL
jgi:hypothetical protein